MPKRTVNKFGLDTPYIRKNLKVFLRDLESYRPDEMQRALSRLAATCQPPNGDDLAEAMNPEFLGTLVTATKVCGWDVDNIAVNDFVAWCHARVKLVCPDTTPFSDE